MRAKGTKPAVEDAWRRKSLDQEVDMPLFFPFLLQKGINNTPLPLVSLPFSFWSEWTCLALKLRWRWVMSAVRPDRLPTYITVSSSAAAQCCEHSTTSVPLWTMGKNTQRGTYGAALSPTCISKLLFLLEVNICQTGIAFFFKLYYRRFKVWICSVRPIGKFKESNTLTFWVFLIHNGIQSEVSDF